MFKFQNSSDAPKAVIRRIDQITVSGVVIISNLDFFKRFILTTVTNNPPLLTKGGLKLHSFCKGVGVDFNGNNY